MINVTVNGRPAKVASNIPHRNGMIPVWFNGRAAPKYLDPQVVKFPRAQRGELITQDEYDRLILIKNKLRAVTHPLRHKMLQLLYLNGPTKVTDVQTMTRIPDQPIVSQHLRVLRDAGLVDTERSGKHIYYSINEKAIAALKKLK